MIFIIILYIDIATTGHSLLLNFSCQQTLVLLVLLQVMIILFTNWNTGSLLQVVQNWPGNLGFQFVMMFINMNSLWERRVLK
jgi:hypothetical protein